MEARFPGAMMQTVRLSGPKLVSPHATAARTASVAKPRPRAHPASTQPISGVPSMDGSIARLYSANPTSPAKRPDARSDTTQ